MGMECSAFAMDIADTLADSAGAEARARAEAHMAECASCRAHAALWDRLGGVSVEVPLMMFAPQRQERFRWWWLAAAAALAIGMFSFFAGRYSAPVNDITALRQEVRSLREVVAISLLDKQSASERLRGIRYSTAMERADPEVVDALSRTLRSDPSVDVRLAAAEALRRFPLSASASESAWQLLERDDSPLVQIAVIDLLASRNDDAVRVRLEQLRDRPGLDKNVRDYLQALLSNQRLQGNPIQ